MLNIRNKHLLLSGFCSEIFDLRETFPGLVKVRIMMIIMYYFEQKGHLSSGTYDGYFAFFNLNICSPRTGACDQ